LRVYVDFDTRGDNSLGAIQSPLSSSLHLSDLLHATPNTPNTSINNNRFRSMKFTSNTIQSCDTSLSILEVQTATQVKGTACYTLKSNIRKKLQERVSFAFGARGYDQVLLANLTVPIVPQAQAKSQPLQQITDKNDTHTTLLQRYVWLKSCFASSN